MSVTAADFYVKVLSILTACNFTSVNYGDYFYRGSKSAMLEKRLYGVYLIASVSMIFQWDCGRCYYNQVEISEEQLLEKIREFAKEEPVEEPDEE